MSARRVVLGALFVALLASVLLVAVAWRSPAPRLTTAAPAGTLHFADLMVVGAVETPAQLDALKRDCRGTASRVGAALAQATGATASTAPAATAVTSARAAFGQYRAFCTRYVADVAVGQQIELIAAEYVQSFRVTGGVRAADGKVYTCSFEDPSRAAAEGPATCWTPDRAAWPGLAGLTEREARLREARADFQDVAGCPFTELADVCAAAVAVDRAVITNARVFADGLRRGDTRLFIWFGVPASIGLAENDAVDAADAAYTAAVHAHGFTDGTPTAYEQAKMRDLTRTIRAGLTAAGR